MTAPTARDALLAHADYLNRLADEVGGGIGAGLELAANMARDRARVLAAATTEPDPGSAATGEGERVSVELSVIVREAVAAERERIARLAEERGAFCCAPCQVGSEDCRCEETPFADLIRSQP